MNEENKSSYGKRKYFCLKIKKTGKRFNDKSFSERVVREDQKRSMMNHV